MLNEMGDRSSMRSRQAMFERFDTDGSGMIDFDEFLNVSSLLYYTVIG